LRVRNFFVPETAVAAGFDYYGLGAPSVDAPANAQTPPLQRRKLG
jgi:hypothetical protein